MKIYERYCTYEVCSESLPSIMNKPSEEYLFDFWTTDIYRIKPTKVRDYEKWYEDNRRDQLAKVGVLIFSFISLSQISTNHRQKFLHLHL